MHPWVCSHSIAQHDAQSYVNLELGAGTRVLGEV